MRLRHVILRQTRGEVLACGCKKANLCYSSVSYDMSRFVLQRVEFDALEIQTTCPKRMGAGVMIGRTLISGVEINMTI